MTKKNGLPKKQAGRKKKGPNDPKEKYRHYTTDDKATALAILESNAGNLTKTAKDLGIPLMTLKKWKEGKGINEEVLAKYTEKAEELSSLFEKATRLYLARAMSHDAVDMASGVQAMTAAGIGTDKMRLLREQPTTIAGKQEVTDDELARRLQALADRLRQRANGAGDDGGIRAIESQPSRPADMESLPEQPSGNGLPQ